MKTILTIITSLLLTATAAAKGTETNSSEAMKKDVERFIKADDKKTGFSHPGTGHYVWNFKYLLNESDAASGRLPQSLKKIDRAFERHTGKATTVLTHSPSDGDSPFHWLSFSWPDTYWSRICFRYNMRDDFTGLPLSPVPTHCARFTALYGGGKCSTTRTPCPATP